MADLIHFLQEKRWSEMKERKTFEWVKCKRKNGKEFLKLIYYSPAVDGYIEAGRFNISTNETVQNEWTLDEIKKEVE